MKLVRDTRAIFGRLLARAPFGAVLSCWAAPVCSGGRFCPAKPVSLHISGFQRYSASSWLLSASVAICVAFRLGLKS